MTEALLSIRGFKGLEKADIPLRPLTVLAGANGAGKSSVTQALRLAREASLISGPIDLNQPGLLLGTFGEVISANLLGDEFTVAFQRGEALPDEIVFRSAESTDDSEHCQTSGRIEALSNIKPWSFVYLSAERLGPRLHQADQFGKRSREYGIGIAGEFSAEVLADNPTRRIPENRMHATLRADGAANTLLLANTEKWLSHIAGPISIRATRPPRLANPLLEYRRPQETSDWQFPTNHGFGVSYALPVVVAGLLLEENGMLIVDSPEAHLHPAAQTAMANFLTHIAASGCTVLIETHSDHIIDGIRLSIADEGNSFSSGDCVFNYITQTEDQTTLIQPIFPRQNGTLPRWPKGFFDQASVNLRKIANLSSNRNG